jgi:hypothetical protein
MVAEKEDAMARHTFRNRLGELVEIPRSQLSSKFDELLDRMQTPTARMGMEAAFHATPAELGEAAVKAARRQR